MYKCICLNVTEDEIKELVKTGLTRIEACKQLGVGSGCGICIQNEPDLKRHYCCEDKLQDCKH